MKQLIVNADDFGLTRGVNQGIMRAHQEGILTSATLMATAREFDHAVALALANPTLGVGCHLVLVGGTAVAPAEEIASLADKDGKLPKSLALFAARVSLGRIRPRDIERELRAQIQKILAAGIKPSHVDTHKHTHVHPVVMEIVAGVVRDYEIKRIRNPIENLRDSWSGVGLSTRLVPAGVVRVIGRRFREIARRYGLASPDHFLGLAKTGQLGPDGLRRMIEMLPEDSTEIMVHPGICDEDLARTGSRLQGQRQFELDGLLDPDVKRAVQASGIRLVSYRGLN
jgi:hopanoid biosynthesis associated protein HpnK